MKQPPKTLEKSKWAVLNQAGRGGAVVYCHGRLVGLLPTCRAGGGASWGPRTHSREQKGIGTVEGSETN